MNKLFISLFVVAAMSFTACGGSAKTEEVKAEEVKVEEVAPVAKTLVQQYDELMTKSTDIAKKVKAGDAAAAADMVKVQEEVTKFMTDNKAALEALTVEEKAEFAKVAEKAAATLAQ